MKVCVHQEKCDHTTTVETIEELKAEVAKELDANVVRVTIEKTEPSE